VFKIAIIVPGTRFPSSAYWGIRPPGSRHRAAARDCDHCPRITVRKIPFIKASDGVETDDAKICSGIDHRLLSGFGHWSFVDR
jgi:hypothetical protein